MKAIDPVAPEELIAAIRRDRRVEQVRVIRMQRWTWDRRRNGDGQELHEEGEVLVQANTEEHGAGGRGISAGSDLHLVARVGFTDDGLIGACELIHSQQYGLVRLVADALGAHE